MIARIRVREGVCNASVRRLGGCPFWGSAGWAGRAVIPPGVMLVRCSRGSWRGPGWFQPVSGHGRAPGRRPGAVLLLVVCAGCCCWSGCGQLPSPVAQELAQVVDRAEELDFVAGGVATVVEVAAEHGKELGEGGLDEAGPAPVQLFPGRGGEPGSHCFPAGRDGGGSGGW